MRRVAAVVTAGCLLSLLTVAQAPMTLMPSPEQQRMGYFAGDWKLTGTIKAAPNAPGGPFTSTEHGAWVDGEFFLETHSSMNSALGNVRGVRVMEYNPKDKAYTYNAYNSLGEHLMAVGHVKGNVWTWESDAQMNGVLAKGRYTITIVTPTLYTFKHETPTSDGGWSTVMEGKATKSP